MAFKAIKEQYKAVFDLVGIYSGDMLLGAVDKVVTPHPIIKFFAEFYPLNARLGVMQRNNAISGKADDEAWENLFMQQLRAFALTETGARITSITETTEAFIRGAVESAMTRAAEEGLGVDKTAKLIRRFLTESLGDIGRSRAKMIAQTEMITGSNQASLYGIESTGLQYRKFWLTSGLKNIRASHIFAEENYPNGILKNQHFDMGNGNKMFMVGDPKGPAEEVINCRCAMLYEVI